jgi:hypothetical protein
MLTSSLSKQELAVVLIVPARHALYSALTRSLEPLNSSWQFQPLSSCSAVVLLDAGAVHDRRDIRVVQRLLQDMCATQPYPCH